MKWTLVFLLSISVPLFAAGEDSAPPPKKTLNLNVLPPKHDKNKPKSLPKLTPMSVVCDFDGTTWATKTREDEERCKMRGGKLRVAAGDGHTLPDMQAIPTKHPTRIYPGSNLDPVNQNPHFKNDPASQAPADGTN